MTNYVCEIGVISKAFGKPLYTFSDDAVENAEDVMCESF